MAGCIPGRPGERCGRGGRRPASGPSPGASARPPTATSGRSASRGRSCGRCARSTAATGAIRMSELAARLGIARRSATSVVDDLVGHGLRRAARRPGGPPGGRGGRHAGRRPPPAPAARPAALGGPSGHRRPPGGGPGDATRPAPPPRRRPLTRAQTASRAFSVEFVPLSGTNSCQKPSGQCRAVSRVRRWATQTVAASTAPPAAIVTSRCGLVPPRGEDVDVDPAEVGADDELHQRRRHERREQAQEPPTTPHR